jgi:hypothetical protein
MFFVFYFNVLTSKKSVIIPDSEVESFCRFANVRGVHPMGGAILNDGWRVLYL